MLDRFIYPRVQSIISSSINYKECFARDTVKFLIYIWKWQIAFKFKSMHAIEHCQTARLPDCQKKYILLQHVCCSSRTRHIFISLIIQFLSIDKLKTINKILLLDFVIKSFYDNLPSFSFRTFT